MHLKVGPTVKFVCCRNLCTLDMRCWQRKCNYCDMRCDCCLRPCLNRYEVKYFPKFGEVQSCSKDCSDILFDNDDCCNLQRIPKELEHFVPSGHIELYRGSFSTESSYPGLNTIVIFSICQSKGQDSNRYKFSPSAVRYVKLWQRSLEKPFFVEYVIDEQFNAIEIIHFQRSKPELSVEERKLMYQFHDMLVNIGIPYQLMKLEIPSTP